MILFPWSAAVTAASPPPFPWVVYYNDVAAVEEFEAYNPIVLDSDTHPPLAPLIAQKKEVLGYIDLGEAEEYRWWFAEAKAAGLLIRENPDWKGSWLVDIRNPVWKKMIIEKIIPQILEKGFTGLFYDQIDVSIALEQENPQLYKGMADAAVDLLQAIRERFPGKRIMLNRGYEILPRVGNFIDYVLAETLFTIYDFKTKKYRWISKEDTEWQLHHVNTARTRFPHLVAFSLDYWDPEDTGTYKKIYEMAQKQCMRAYVTTINLDALTPAPQ